MRHTDTKPKRPHLSWPGHVSVELLYDEFHTHLVAGVDVFELRGDVLFASPFHAGQIRVVADAEVLKGAEETAFERIPKAEFGGDVTVEPAEHGAAVGTLGGGGKAEE